MCADCLRFGAPAALIMKTLGLSARNETLPKKYQLYRTAILKRKTIFEELLRLRRVFPIRIL
jgi:hypothetical protein